MNNDLLQLAAARRGRLDESHKLQSFYRDAEEEEMWITEKEYSLQSTDYGHDLNSCMILLNKHEVSLLSSRKYVLQTFQREMYK